MPACVLPFAEEQSILKGMKHHTLTDPSIGRGEFWRFVLKHFYKFVGLCIIFGVSMFFFSKNIPDISVGKTTATSLQASTFPIVYLQLDKHQVNTLHGYSSQQDSAQLRESITPLDTSKAFTAQIAENELEIKKLDYELQDIPNKKTISSDSLTAFTQEDSYKTVRIRLDAPMDTGTEYGLQITLTTSYSKKIYFYTRIKYYDSDFYLDEKLNFVHDFHDATYGYRTLSGDPFLTGQYSG